MSDTLLVEDRGSVRLLTLNRPDKLNALDVELTKALGDALASADIDGSVRAIVVTGAGHAFCAGADTSEFKDLTSANEKRVAERAELTLRVQSLPRSVSKPVVAAARGVAVGGGAGLALAADMLVVASDLRFGYPELKHGLIPALVMTSMSRHFGPKLAFELIGTGRLLTGRELADLGIANRVTTPDAVIEEALDIAQMLVTRPHRAMAASKTLLHQVEDLDFDAAMQAGRDANILMRSFSRETS
ncbi:enoyl-CoA hydratase/isomerase family protein [Corticibacterium sp. UT-5YL-CI-8]|nr:enoyl-CoA hydratase/isomerase family protein [Tianweitania sp. UT-5YL-CI-8]